MNEVNIAEVIVHGVAFDPKNYADVKSMDLNELYQSVPRLFDLLEEREIDFALVGGIAMLVYVEGRNTQDVDLIVSPSALEKLPEVIVEDRQGDFVRARLGNLQVDLLLASNALFDKVRRNYTQPRTAGDREIRCATVEGLLLLKLFALPSLYGQGNFDRVELYERDIAMLVRDYQPDVEPLLAELSKHLLESEVTEIRNILADVRQRIERSKRRFAFEEERHGASGQENDAIGE